MTFRPTWQGIKDKFKARSHAQLHRKHSTFYADSDSVQKFLQIAIPNY